MKRTVTSAVRSRCARHALASLLLAVLALSIAAPAAAAPAEPTTATTAEFAAQSLDADDEERPRAAAGVDQTVTRGTTVLLDATPSFAPDDGEIVDYEWTIHTPHNETVDPECDVASCRLARFPAVEHGRYAVELEVRDDSGLTATDTMYVTTETINEFGLSLSGPDDAGSVTLRANVTAGNATLTELQWYRGTELIDNRSLSGVGDVYEREVSAEPTQTFVAVATAADNRTVGDTWTAPRPGVVTPRDYPYIEGPTELTGEPDFVANETAHFEATYRVHTALPSLEPEVVWTRDGTDAHKGRTYTDSIPAGEHGVTATVVFAEHSAVSGRNFGQVGGDATKSLQGFTGEYHATVDVVADPAPEIQRSVTNRNGDVISIDTRVRDLGDNIDTLRFKIGDRTVHTENSIQTGSGGAVTQTVHFTVPEGISGQSEVTLQVVDDLGQSTTRTQVIDLPGGSSDDTSGSSEEMLPRRPY